MYFDTLQGRLLIFFELLTYFDNAVVIFQVVTYK